MSFQPFQEKDIAAVSEEDLEGVWNLLLTTGEGPEAEVFSEVNPKQEQSLSKLDYVSSGWSVGFPCSEPCVFICEVEASRVI